MRCRSGSAITCWRMAFMRSRRSMSASAPGVVSATSGVVPVSESGLVQIDGRGGALVPGVAGVVDAQVGGDAVEPGAEAGLRTIGFARAVDAEEDLLGEFFGDRLVVHHAVHEVNDRLAVLLEQEVEGGHVAGASSSMMAASSMSREVAAPWMRVGRFGCGFEESRIDRQSAHIFRNPIFGLRLRWFVEFRRISVAVWAVASRCRATGIQGDR